MAYIDWEWYSNHFPLEEMTEDEFMRRQGVRRKSDKPFCKTGTGRCR